MWEASYLEKEVPSSRRVHLTVHLHLWRVSTRLLEETRRTINNHKVNQSLLESKYGLQTSRGIIKGLDVVPMRLSSV